MRDVTFETYEHYLEFRDDLAWWLAEEFGGGLPIYEDEETGVEELTPQGQKLLAEFTLTADRLMSDLRFGWEA